MEVLLDTNFIISSLLKKIDFLGELEGMGFKIILPREVLQELKDFALKTVTKRSRLQSSQAELEKLSKHAQGSEKDKILKTIEATIGKKLEQAAQVQDIEELQTALKEFSQWVHTSH